jgi:hypothetical protein
MFETMKLYGLGMEEATRALIVSKVFQKELDSISDNDSAPKGEAFVETIQKLVSKISLDNLLYESDSSVDLASHNEEEILTIRPELRVDPICATLNNNQASTVDREIVYRKTAANRRQNNKNGRKATTANSNAAAASSSTSTSSSGRKRKIDTTGADLDDNEKQQHQRLTSSDTTRVGSAAADTTSRPRSDSATADVDSKFTSIHTPRDKRFRSGVPSCDSEQIAASENKTG